MSPGAAATKAPPTTTMWEYGPVWPDPLIFQEKPEIQIYKFSMLTQIYKKSYMGPTNHICGLD